MKRPSVKMLKGEREGERGGGRGESRVPYPQGPAVQRQEDPVVQQGCTVNALVQKRLVQFVTPFKE